MSLKIIVDLDGVVFNFTESLKMYLVDHRGFDPARLADTTTWDFYKDDWGLTLDEYLKLCHDGVNDQVVFRQGPTWPGAVEGIHKLQRRGHTIHIATDRSFGSRSPQNTTDWLEEQGITYESITFGPDKTLIHADLIIEDRDKNYIAVEQAGNATPVLITRPWNVDLVGARRVSNWEEFVDFVDRWERLHA